MGFDFNKYINLLRLADKIVKKIIYNEGKSATRPKYHCPT
jgi:hypothetical protein